MRTTLDLDDDVMAVARVLAAERGVSIGRALSDLARRGLRPQAPGLDGAIPVFAVEPGAAPITPEMVRVAADES